MRTQVVIIGSGPSGLLLGQLLKTIGVETIILDRVNKDYILGRVRAGVLEEGTVRLIKQVGLHRGIQNDIRPDSAHLTMVPAQ